MLLSARAVRAGVLGAMALAAGLLLPGCKTGTEIAENDPGVVDTLSIGSSDEKLQELQFMAGSWRAMDGDGLSEELWSIPHGKSIIGTFRVSDRAGELKMQESLAIVAEPEGVFMRLRHFDAWMVSREGKESPIVLKLESAAGQKAAFRCVSGSKSLATITYWRIGQTLHSEVAFTPESKREALTFEMRRLATQPH
jgi:hypothetical protein